MVYLEMKDVKKRLSEFFLEDTYLRIINENPMRKSRNLRCTLAKTNIQAIPAFTLSLTCTLNQVSSSSRCLGRRR